ncbi:MAG: O-antigen ligase family protein, partial [Desulfobacteraceae bacterium]|nr:O-antigen ligase family protein [Desulfobacteraceae bacterium]
HKPRTDDSNFLQGILEIFKQEKANIHILIGTGALLVVTSIFVCLSRGGIISTCIGLLFFLFLSFKKKVSRKGSLFVICMVIIAGLSIAWFGWSSIQKRFSSLHNTDGTISGERLDYWKDSQNIIKDFPLTGSGFGTFKDIYPSVQSLDSSAYLEHAHNDYIELITEGGITGFLLVFSILTSIFYKTYKSFSFRKDAYSIYIYIGSITGMI